MVIVAIAVSLFLFRPKAKANQRLALFLVAEAVGLGAGWGLAQMALQEGHAAFWTALAWAAYSAQIPLYLLFLSTLKTPLVRPFSARPASVSLWSLVVVGLAVAIVRPELYFAGFEPRPGVGTFIQTPGPLGTIVPAIHALPLPLFALVVAIHQWRKTSRGSAFRRQGASYALAFGWRDLSALILLSVIPSVTGASVTDSDLLPTLFYALFQLLFVSLLAYGILSTQLFDIDVKARLVVGQSTFAGIVAAAFFAIKETVEALVDVQGLATTVLAAAVITLVFRPLQTLGKKVAGKVLPVRTDDQEAAHKLELYESALESFQQDGKLTEREVAALERIRDRLGLSREDVAHLDVLAEASAMGVDKDPERP